ncbi:MAG: transposase [Trichodesmium sp. MAG_R04]|nr:transposase [Trichodesmium sp. MAG_R04]
MYKLSTSIINYNQLIVLEDLNVSGMKEKWCDPSTTTFVREPVPIHRKLSRIIGITS